MKYCVLIIDGASGWPLLERSGKTCLELADTPNLDVMAKEGIVGLCQTIPMGVEPSSACACMSVLGYDPKIYYRGRAAIEAVSMGIPIEKGEVVFRCNMIAVKDGKMWSYCAGHIHTDEAKKLLEVLNEALGNENIEFYPGVGYRHLLKLKGYEDALSAICTPPHDIPDKPIVEFLPHGQGSDCLRQIMQDSIAVLGEHPINKMRFERGDIPANMIWLFWGSGQVPNIPTFKQVYGLSAALTSGVDLLRGRLLAKFVQS